MFIVNVEGAMKINDKWLIIKRSKEEEHAGGLLSLVGGKVDVVGNSRDILERTIKREMLEEVGVKITDNLSYVNSTTFVTDKNIKVVNTVFVCEYQSGEAFPKSLNEVEEVLWLSTDEIMNHSKAPTYLKESIKRANSMIQNK